MRRRSEALEELASNVRDFRAESPCGRVHGPSLAERRSSRIRRTKSLVLAGWGSYSALSAAHLEDDDPADEGAGKSAGSSCNSPPSSTSQRSSMGGSRRRSSRRKCRGGSLVVADGRILRSGVDTPPLLDEGYHDQDADEGDGGVDVECIVLPSDAARSAVDAVHSLVSALYGLSDSPDVPTEVADKLLEYAPRVDLAFGRIRTALCELELESDVPDADDERMTWIVRGVWRASELLYAASETVRRAADASAEGALHPIVECRYATVLELLSLTCLEVHRLDEGLDPPERWEVSGHLRRAWTSAGRRAELRVVEAATSAGGGECAGEKGGGGGVDPELFREAAALALRNAGRLSSSGATESFLDGRGLLDRVREDDAVGAIGNDLDIAVALFLLGKVRTAMGEHGVALEHFKEVYHIRKSRLSNGDRLVVITLKAIAGSYWHMNRKAAADRCLAEAVEAMQRPVQNDDDGVDDESGTARVDLLASLFLSWSDLKVDMYDPDAAIDVLTRCAAAQKKAPGRNDGPALAATLYRRGSLLMERGRDDEALADFDKVLRIRIRSYGLDHPSVGNMLHILGVLQFKRGEDALELLWGALQIRKKQSQDNGGGLKAADSLVVIGNIHREMGHHVTAIRMYEEALELRTEGLGAEDERVANVHVALGHAKSHLKRFNDAAGHYRAGLLIIKKARGNSDGRFLRFLQFLGTAQLQAGKLREAKLTLEELVHLQRDGGKADGADYSNSLHLLERVNQLIGRSRGSQLSVKLAQSRQTSNEDARRKPSWMEFSGKRDGASPEGGNGSLAKDNATAGHGSEGSVQFEESWFGSFSRLFGAGLSSPSSPSPSGEAVATDKENKAPTTPGAGWNRGTTGRTRKSTRASISAQKLSDLDNPVPISAVDHLWALQDLTSSSMPPDLSE